MQVGTNIRSSCARARKCQKDPNPAAKVLRLTLILGRAPHLDLVLCLYLYLALSHWALGPSLIMAGSASCGSVRIHDVRIQAVPAASHFKKQEFGKENLFNVAAAAANGSGCDVVTPTTRVSVSLPVEN
jgi:hypothetical protein